MFKLFVIRFSLFVKPYQTKNKQQITKNHLWQI